MRNAGYTHDCSCGPEIGYIRGGLKHKNGDVPFNVFKDAFDQLKAENEALTVALAALEARVAALEHEEPPAPPPDPIEIVSFVISPKTGEIGKTVTVTATWELKGTAKTATINGVDVKGVTTKTFDATQTTEYKLIVTDEQGNTAQKTAKINFANYVYWGISQAETATESDIKALPNKQLTDTVSRALGTVHCGTGAWIYYAYPKRLGNVRITQYGMEGGFDLQSEITVNSEVYKIYRSSHNLNGDVVEIQVSSVT